MAEILRLWLVVSPEEDEEINRAYAQYLLDSDEHKSRNKWIVEKIMEAVRRKEE